MHEELKTADDQILRSRDDAMQMNAEELSTGKKFGGAEHAPEVRFWYTYGIFDT